MTAMPTVSERNEFVVEVGGLRGLGRLGREPAQIRWPGAFSQDGAPHPWPAHDSALGSDLTSRNARRQATVCDAGGPGSMTATRQIPDGRPQSFIARIGRSVRSLFIFHREHVSYVSAQVRRQVWTGAVGKVDEIHNLNLRTRVGAEASDQLKYLSERIPATFVYAGVDVGTAGMFSGTRGKQLAGRFGTIADANHLPLTTLIGYLARCSNITGVWRRDDAQLNRAAIDRLAAISGLSPVCLERALPALGVPSPAPQVRACGGSPATPRWAPSRHATAAWPAAGSPCRCSSTSPPTCTFASNMRSGSAATNRTHCARPRSCSKSLLTRSAATSASSVDTARTLLGTSTSKPSVSSGTGCSVAGTWTCRFAGISDDAASASASRSSTTPNCSW
jgi:hypothetical protein